MKKILSLKNSAVIILMLFQLILTAEVFAQTTTQNYIRVREPRRAIPTDLKLDQLSSNKDSVMVSIQYIDGLGRPLQSVQRQASPAAKDMVQPVVYDQYGREVKKYLPYAATTADGSYKSNAFIAQPLFYNPSGSTGAQQSNGIVRTTMAFSETGFEPSPLNRAAEQGAPGEAWQLPTSGTGNASSTGNTVRIVYTTNDNIDFNSALLLNNPGYHKVARYDALINTDKSRTLRRLNNNTATYSNGQLYLTIIRDENWKPADGCIGTNEEYKDKEGHVILKRNYNLKAGVIELISTYYVYDDLGNLCFVIPQSASPDATSAVSSTSLARYCYHYRYDERNRLIQKRIPAKGWDFVVYNKLDQPVATQDSIQRNRTPQEWTITKYDVMGRPVITGIYQHAGSIAGQNIRADIQTLVNGQTNEWETRVATGNGYSTNTWPNTLATTLSVSYYDSYVNIPDLPAVYDKQSNSNYSKMTNGLLTATKINVLGSTDMLWTVPYYDDEARTVTSYSQHYLGGASAYSAYNFDVDSTLYNFNDQPTRLTRRHYAKNATNTAATLYLTTTDYYSYDHMGRKRRDQNQLRHRANNSQPVMVLSDYTYSEIGQLRAKRLHSINSGSDYLQRLDYRYNTRGWLSYINNADLAADGGITNSDTNDQFGMELKYETAATSRPQYNGNIASVKWKAGPANGAAQPQYSYDYGYDRINRLTEGESSTSGTKNRNYSEYLQYNTMGNIQKLGRYELVGATRTQIDSLTYSYNGHQLHRVDDASGYTGPGGFNDPVQVDNEYTYDGNGNLRKDQNKGISLITYNMLNLPQNITINGNTVNYTYDATGKKLRKIYTAGSISDTTQYVDGIQYNGSNIDFVQTEEGRARRSGTSYIYEYDLKDHLGNTRVTLKADPADATDTTPLVLQQNSYYPFGASIKSLEPIVPMPKNEYLYNGKELQEETGLYDYGARFYDPVIGRFTTVDPLAVDYPWYTPYQYAGNEVPNAIDRDGLEPAYLKPDGSYSLARDGQLQQTLTGKEGKNFKTFVDAKTNNIGTREYNDPLAQVLGEIIGAVVIPLNTIVTGELPNGGKADGADRTVAGIQLIMLTVTSKGGGPNGAGVKGEVPVLPDNFNVVRGGIATPEQISNGTGTHPTAGVTGFSVECGSCSVPELASPLRNNQIGVTTVGTIRSAGGDVIKTKGSSPNHATVTGLAPLEASRLLTPSVKNPNPKKD